MKRLFGTDGIRGIAYSDITKELVIKVANAIAYIFNKKDKGIKVIIGNDGRESADMILSTLKEELLSCGISVLDAGLIPTPGISYLVKYYNYDLGIMISASHNPHEYNGIKIFDKEGYKLLDDVEARIEDLIFDNIKYSSTKRGIILDSRDVIKDYGNHLLDSLNKYNNNVNYNNLNIGIDASNGASSKVCEYIFSKLGSKYHIINNAPNGTNINNNCGSTHPEVLSSYVINNKLDIGIAYDGDADRLIAVDEKGHEVDGDHIMILGAVYLKKQNKLANDTLVVTTINGDYTLAIISNDLKNKNRLNKNTIVGTILSNLGLLEYCKNNDIEFITTNVGDKYVLEYLRDNNLSLGGEEAGHIILKEYCNTGDGPLTSLIMLSILASTNTTFSNLTKIMHKYPEVHINIKVNNKNDFATSNIIEDSIKEIKNNFNGNYRLVVRPSGTEPLVRIVLEGEELKVLEESSNKIKSIIKNLNMEVV